MKKGIGKYAIDDIMKELKKYTVDEIISKSHEYDEIVKELTETLMYLEETGRFMEDPDFKNADFKTYVEGRFLISWSQYQANKRLVRALNDYPAECKKYGIGLVMRVMRKPGIKKAKLVFEEFEKVNKKRGTPITLGKCEEIILAFSKYGQFKS